MIRQGELNLNKQRGMSLVEVMVVTSILTVTFTVLASVFTSQQRVSAQMADKLASLDLARTLTATLAGGGVCTFMLSLAPAYTFDPMNLGAVSVPPFPQIPSRAMPGATPALVANGVAAAAPNSPRLVATAIRIANVTCAVPPCAPTTNQFNANLIVEFDNSRLAASMAPLTFPIALTTTGPAGAQRLASCTINGGGGGGALQDPVFIESAAESCLGQAANPNCPAVPAAVVAACPVGSEVSSCGYRVSRWPANAAAALSGDATPGDDHITSAPADVYAVGNGCTVRAGDWVPGCGVCFVAQAICIRVQ